MTIIRGVDSKRKKATAMGEFRREVSHQSRLIAPQGVANDSMASTRPNEKKGDCSNVLRSLAGPVHQCHGSHSTRFGKNIEKANQNDT